MNKPRKVTAQKPRASLGAREQRLDGAGVQIAQAGPALLAALAVLLTAAVYLRVAGFAFIHLDDTLYVTENPHVLAGLTVESLRWALSFNETNYWQPITWLSLLVDSTFYGDWAGGYHLTNLVLHCVNVALLYFLALSWFGLARPEAGGAKWAAFGVALAFGLHPVHVESVAWVTERKDVLFVLFGLLCLRSYTLYAQTRATGRAANLLPTLAFYVLSLLAKPMLVTLPVILLLLDFWPLGRLRRGTAAGSKTAWSNLPALLLEKALLLLPALAMVAIALTTHPKAYGAVDPGLALKLANAVASYLDYLRLVFFPAGLALVYPYPDAVPAAKVIAAAILLLAVSAGALAQLKRRPYLAVCWLWFVLSLTPVLMPPKVGLHVAYADRWLYFPAIGLYRGLALLAWEALERLDARRRHQATAGILIALGLVLGALCSRQLGWWKDGMTVYERVLAVTDDNYFVMNNYGVHKMRAGDFQAAEKWMRMSLTLQPGYSKALGNLGILYTNTGRYAQALPYFAAAIAKDTLEPSELAEDQYCMALCLSNLGRFDEAEPHYMEALKINPGYAQAYNDLGNIAGLRGQPELAEQYYAKALALNPQYAVARENLARVRAMRAAPTGKSPPQTP